MTGSAIFADNFWVSLSVYVKSFMLVHCRHKLISLCKMFYTCRHDKKMYQIMVILPDGIMILAVDRDMFCSMFSELQYLDLIFDVILYQTLVMWPVVLGNFAGKINVKKPLQKSYMYQPNQHFHTRVKLSVK